jgi:hypothetical protein
MSTHEMTTADGPELCEYCGVPLDEDSPEIRRHCGQAAELVIGTSGQPDRIETTHAGDGES